MEHPDNLVQYLSYVAGNFIYELANTFENKEDYKPLEGLAVALQREIVEKGCIYLNENATA
jgi:hypothetical protein